MVFEKCRKIVADQMDIEEDKITLDSNLVDDIGADSLDIVEMLMNIESEFGIQLDDDIVMNFKTMKDVVDYIESNK